ncbi:MAG: hypothetical protein IPL87_04245 [Candidatus Moraniibacteriota bacterium]|nr:MAG: hypothetical protein IPL87_04245 [Candidatus Moranbacteria bacterium]
METVTLFREQHFNLVKTEGYDVCHEEREKEQYPLKQEIMKHFSKLDKNKRKKSYDKNKNSFYRRCGHSGHGQTSIFKFPCVSEFFRSQKKSQSKNSAYDKNPCRAYLCREGSDEDSYIAGLHDEKRAHGQSIGLRGISSQTEEEEAKEKQSVVVRQYYPDVKLR